MNMAQVRKIKAIEEAKARELADNKESEKEEKVTEDSTSSSSSETSSDGEENHKEANHPAEESNQNKPEASVNKTEKESTEIKPDMKTEEKDGFTLSASVKDEPASISERKELQFTKEQAFSAKDLVLEKETTPSQITEYETSDKNYNSSSAIVNYDVEKPKVLIEEIDSNAEEIRINNECERIMNSIFSSDGTCRFIKNNSSFESIEEVSSDEEDIEDHDLPMEYEEITITGLSPRTLIEEIAQRDHSTQSPIVLQDEEHPLADEESSSAILQETEDKGVMENKNINRVETVSICMNKRPCTEDLSQDTDTNKQIQLTKVTPGEDISPEQKIYREKQNIENDCVSDTNASKDPKSEDSIDSEEKGFIKFVEDSEQTTENLTVNELDSNDFNETEEDSCLAVLSEEGSSSDTDILSDLLELEPESNSIKLSDWQRLAFGTSFESETTEEIDDTIDDPELPGHSSHVSTHINGENLSSSSRATLNSSIVEDLSKSSLAKKGKSNEIFLSLQDISEGVLNCTLEPKKVKSLSNPDILNSPEKQETPPCEDLTEDGETEDHLITPQVIRFINRSLELQIASAKTNNDNNN